MINCKLFLSCFISIGLSSMMFACDDSSGNVPDESVLQSSDSQSDVLESSSGYAIPLSSSDDVREELVSSSSVKEMIVSSSSVAISTAKYGSLQDSRDGKIYKTIEIGGRIWMAENLNFSKSLDGSIVLDSTFCYDDVLANCEMYGRLYQEDEAIKACPDGWNIPTDEEWSALRDAVKSEFGVSDANGPLRAVGGWEDKVSATNASGFTALPAGYRSKSGQYDGGGSKTYFWGESSMLYYGWILSRQYELDKESLIRGYYAYSIRCVKSSL